MADHESRTEQQVKDKIKASNKQRAGLFIAFIIFIGLLIFSSAAEAEALPVRRIYQFTNVHSAVVRLGVFLLSGSGGFVGCRSPPLSSIFLILKILKWRTGPMAQYRTWIDYRKKSPGLSGLLQGLSTPRSSCPKVCKAFSHNDLAACCGCGLRVKSIPGCFVSVGYFK